MVLPPEERMCLCDNCWICEEDAKLTMADLEDVRRRWPEIEREAIERLLKAIEEHEHDRRRI